MPTTIPDLSETIEPMLPHKPVSRAKALPLKEFHDEHKAWFEASAYRSADDSCAPLIYNQMIGMQPVKMDAAAAFAAVEEMKAEVRLEDTLNRMLDELETE